jgi:hypothetical protein
MSAKMEWERRITGVMEMIDREADGSDSLEVSIGRAMRLFLFALLTE